MAREPEAREHGPTVTRSQAGDVKCETCGPVTPGPIGPIRGALVAREHLSAHSGAAVEPRALYAA